MARSRASSATASGPASCAASSAAGGASPAMSPASAAETGARGCGRQWAHGGRNSTAARSEPEIARSTRSADTVDAPTGTPTLASARRRLSFSAESASSVAAVCNAPLAVAERTGSRGATATADAGATATADAGTGSGAASAVVTVIVTDGTAAGAVAGVTTFAETAGLSPRTPLRSAGGAAPESGARAYICRSRRSRRATSRTFETGAPAGSAAVGGGGGGRGGGGGSSSRACGAPAGRSAGSGEERAEVDGEESGSPAN